MNDRQRTTTSNFGVSKRESHDASDFYARFDPPNVDDRPVTAADLPAATSIEEPFVVGDARSMTTIADNSVALVVTSPPYFAGKKYEEELERDGVPSSYIEYLELLRDVFAECVRVLEPGGRIAVNVANLGRKPYRSLAADVIGILQDQLGLLLRGEIVWQKGAGASGSCAWGSFRGPSNPVLRDITERIIVASKGRFQRALAPTQRAAAGLPAAATIGTEDFMALTLDVWHTPAESATRIGHPAPFPVELPEKLIELYTYDNDLVLDPFMGSGSTLVAAARLGRRYVGYDLDPDYVDLARQRVLDEGNPGQVLPVGEASGKQAVAAVLTEAGFRRSKNTSRYGHSVKGTGVAVHDAVVDAEGRDWLVEIGGPFTRHRAGLTSTDAVYRVLGKAAAVHNRPERLLILTSQLPRRGTTFDQALRAAGPELIFDVIDVFDAAARSRLAEYATGVVTDAQPGFW